MTEFVRDNYEEIFKRLRDFVPIHRGHVLNLDNKRSTDANYLCKLSSAINKYGKKKIVQSCVIETRTS